MLRYFTAGESHGKTMLAIVDGFPAGVTIDANSIDVELRRRQGGYGRGGRQRIETDRVEVMTGIWQGKSLGSPIAMQVVNRDGAAKRDHHSKWPPRSGLFDHMHDWVVFGHRSTIKAT